MTRKSTIGLIIIEICLLILSQWFLPEVHSTPNQQATATCPAPGPTPDLSQCYAGYPEPVWDRQPNSDEFKPIFQKVALNQLGTAVPALTPIVKGIGDDAVRISPYVPCILLETMAYIESDWRQFDTTEYTCGYTLVGIDILDAGNGESSCGAGMMQITTGMDDPDNGIFDPDKIMDDYVYGIGTGARFLGDKWEQLNHYVGENNPHVVEDWYYAVWAYNSWGYVNNPTNNNLFSINRGEYLCDGSQNHGLFPYQELVWGCAANPPSDAYWNATDLSYPDSKDLGVPDDDQNNPKTYLPRPEPAHRSCSIIYLPIVLKSEVVSTPTPMPTSTVTPTAIPDIECTYIDNLLENHDFGYQLDAWQVWIDATDFNQANLIDYNHYDPGNSFPAAYLGGENDACQPTDTKSCSLLRGDFVDQYIAQEVTLPENTQFVALEYSYCLETEETTFSRDHDEFVIEIQTQLGGELILLDSPLKYTNRYNYQGECSQDEDLAGWRRVGESDTPRGDGQIIVPASEYAGENITLVFYSDVDETLISTFYIDAVKIKACVGQTNNK